MWSFGCTLYELFSGSILFTGESNNEMLRAQMKLCGPIPKDLLESGQFTKQHFAENGDFKIARSKKTNAATEDLPTEDDTFIKKADLEATVFMRKLAQAACSQTQRDNEIYMVPIQVSMNN